VTLSSFGTRVGHCLEALLKNFEGTGLGHCNLHEKKGKRKTLRRYQEYVKKTTPLAKK